MYYKQNEKKWYKESTYIKYNIFCWFNTFQHYQKNPRHRDGQIIYLYILNISDNIETENVLF